MVANSPQQITALQREHRRLRRIVASLAELCRRPLDDTQFYPQFVEHVVQALDGWAGAVWTTESDNALVCRWQKRSKLQERMAAENDFQRHRPLVQRALDGDTALHFTHADNPQIDPHHEVVAVAMKRHERSVAIVEIVLPADLARCERKQELAFLNKMAQLAAQRPARSATTHEQPQSVSPDSKAARSLQRLSAFTRTIHQSLDLETTGYVVANEVRSMLGCDRVSLAVERGGSARLLAISGQDSIDRRADVVRQLEALARLGLNAQESLWCDRDEPIALDRLTQLGKLAHEDGVDSPWSSLGIVPLREAPQGRCAGVLIVEQIDSEVARDELTRRTDLLAPHVTQALVNACDHQGILLLPLWRALGQWAGGGAVRWRKRIVWATVLLAVLAFLGFFPVPLRVHGRGALQPATQRDVFADVEGVVAEVYVQHGDSVQAGDPLAKLHNSDLEMQIADVLGRRRAAQEHLTAIARRRHEERLSREVTDRLTGQTLQLQEQLRGLDQQHELLLQKQERLVIRSPIAGRIATWDVHRRLMLRPVAAGQVLLTVADETGPWQLEVYFAEADVGHLRPAVAASESEMPVTFLAVSEPAKNHTGILAHVDDHAQLYDDHGHAVRALVDIDRTDMPDAPAGTTVRARIDCGCRPIGYVWLHRLAGFLYTRVLFRIG